MHQWIIVCLCAVVCTAAMLLPGALFVLAVALFDGAARTRVVASDPPANKKNTKTRKMNDRTTATNERTADQRK